ncbi:peritrophin-1-like [Saccostrea cucullata]|uniref:peritrophin-1-like n=1 Tax=Saccostrea cuccullata TaxID=36930 RepID=UPI002ED10C8C
MQFTWLYTIVLLSLVVCCTGGKKGGCKTGDTSPDENDCTKYFVCDNGANVTMQCPFGTAWSDKKATCVRADTVGCKIKLQSVKAESGNFTCPATFGYFADPDNCTKFYMCSWGKPTSKQCVGNTGWDSKGKFCNYKDNLSGCS